MLIKHIEVRVRICVRCIYEFLLDEAIINRDFGQKLEKLRSEVLTHASNLSRDPV